MDMVEIASLLFSVTGTAFFLTATVYLGIGTYGALKDQRDSKKLMNALSGNITFVTSAPRQKMDA